MNKRYFSKEEFQELKSRIRDIDYQIDKDGFQLVPFDICDGLGLLQQCNGPDKLMESFSYPGQYVGMYYIPDSYYRSVVQASKTRLWTSAKIEEELKLFDLQLPAVGYTFLPWVEEESDPLEKYQLLYDVDGMSEFDSLLIEEIFSGERTF